MAEEPTRTSDATPLSRHVWRQIDAVCEEFEKSWQTGRPSVDAFLERVPPEGQAVLRAELAAIEEHYVQQGQQATRSDRYPGPGPGARGRGYYTQRHDPAIDMA